MSDDAIWDAAQRLVDIRRETDAMRLGLPVPCDCDEPRPVYDFLRQAEVCEGCGGVVTTDAELAVSA